MIEIKAIFFDLGNTLIDNSSFLEKYGNHIDQKLLKTIGLMLELKTVEKLRKKTKKYLEERYKGDPKKHKEGLFFSTMCKFLGKKISFKKAKELDKSFNEHIHHNATLLPNSKDVLKELKRRKIKCVLVSNGLRNRVNKYLNTFNLKKFFDLIVISESIGKEKSTGYLFRYALKKLHLNPQNIIVVGDRVDEDIKSAKKLGLKTVRMNFGPYSKNIQPNEDADFVINNIKDLIKLLDGLNRKDLDIKKIKQIIKLALNYYKKLDISHNINHLLVTLKLAEYIAKKEKANVLIVLLGALLHQFHDPKNVEKILKEMNIDSQISKEIVHCVECISRKTIHKAKTIEAKVVFDADKLQMIGPIGIFRYCANKNLNTRILDEAKNAEEEVYAKYFQTKTAKKLARKPHKIVKIFFNEIYKFLKIKLK